MASETLHAPRDRLSRDAILLHQAIVSLMEELEAVDWYRQRADDCDDTALREILLHNMREEIEHASMALEWIRRNNSEFDKQLREYLFTERPITAAEAEATGRSAGAAVEDQEEAGGGAGDQGGPGGHRGNETADPQHNFTVGALKD